MASGTGAAVLAGADYGIAIGGADDLDEPLDIDGDGKTDQVLAISAARVGVDAARSIAIGYQARVADGAQNAVALGFGALATESNTFSIGSDKLQRRLVNVAAGESGTDAVNLSQLEAAIAGVGGAIDLSPIQSRLGALETGFGGLQTSVSGFGLRLDGAEAALADHGGRLGGAETALAQLSSNDAVQDQRLSALEAGGGGGGGANVDQEILELRQRATNTETNVAALNAAAVVQDSRISSAESEIDALQAGQTEQGARLDAVEQGMEGLAAAQQELERVVGLGNVEVAEGASDAVALGEGASTAGSNTVTLGSGAQTQSDGAVAIGNNSVAMQNNSVAIGNNAVARSSVAVGTGAQAIGTNTTALGDNAEASGNFAVAIGNNAVASADNSVALGNGSVADEADTVSVGSSTQTRRITRVARGIRADDAATVGQLNEGIGSLRGDLSKAAKLAYSGTAIAMATMPSPVVLKPGQFAITGGVAGYRGEGALGFNLSRLADDGRSAINLGVGIADQEASAVRASYTLILGGN